MGALPPEAPGTITEIIAWLVANRDWLAPVPAAFVGGLIAGGLGWFASLRMHAAEREDEKLRHGRDREAERQRYERCREDEERRQRERTERNAKAIVLELLHVRYSLMYVSEFKDDAPPTEFGYAVHRLDHHSKLYPTLLPWAAEIGDAAGGLVDIFAGVNSLVVLVDRAVDGESPAGGIVSHCRPFAQHFAEELGRYHLQSLQRVRSGDSTSRKRGLSFSLLGFFYSQNF